MLVLYRALWIAMKPVLIIGAVANSGFKPGLTLNMHQHRLLALSGESDYGFSFYCSSGMDPFRQHIDIL